MDSRGLNLSDVWITYSGYPSNFYQPEKLPEVEMSKVRTHTFNGVNYKIDICSPIDGLCDYPRAGRKPTIVIADDLKTKKGLETAIHEAMHACFWAQQEEKVTRDAFDIAKFLWRLGYRKVK